MASAGTQRLRIERRAPAPRRAHGEMLATLSKRFGDGRPRSSCWNPVVSEAALHRVTRASHRVARDSSSPLPLLNYARQVRSDGRRTTSRTSGRRRSRSSCSSGSCSESCCSSRRGCPSGSVFALRRPARWGRAARPRAARARRHLRRSLVYTGLLSLFGDFDPTEEQGLVPDGWDSSRAGAVHRLLPRRDLLGPTVEELTYRGLGLSLLSALRNGARDRRHRGALRPGARAPRRASRPRLLRNRGRLAPRANGQRLPGDRAPRRVQRHRADGLGQRA